MVCSVFDFSPYLGIFCILELDVYMVKTTLFKVDNVEKNTQESLRKTLLYFFSIYTATLKHISKKEIIS